MTTSSPPLASIRCLRTVLFSQAHMDNLVERALAFATAAHEGQIDRDGNLHIRHCERVAACFEDPVLVAASLLHDVIEDTAVTLVEVDAQFGSEVAIVVDLLTRRDGQSFGDYLHQIVGDTPERHSSCLHMMAAMIKIADIEDNLQRCDAKMAPKRPMYENGLSLLRSRQ